MRTHSRRESGGSLISTLILLAVLGYGIFIGLQYVPQWVESRSVQSILDTMGRSQGADPVHSVDEARAKVIRMLQINELNEMVNSFTVKRVADQVEIVFSYDRQLNLGYKTKEIHYEHSVRL